MMEKPPSPQIIQHWPEESREAARLVIDKYRGAEKEES